jgi:hypothetical protein
MSIKVSPNAKNPTHDIALSDGAQTWGLLLDGGIRGIRELVYTPDTKDIFRVEQRTWDGGRGLDDFSEDPTRFFDSMNLWSLTPGRIMPAPLWRFAKGYRNADGYWLHYNETDTSSTPPWKQFDWAALLGNQRYLGKQFTASASYNADKVYVWVRRRGNPGTLSIKLYTKGVTYPDTELESVDITTSTITDTVGVFQVADWSGTRALTSGTNYFIVAVGDSNDNQANHWEIATSGGSGVSSADGITWASSSPYGGPYFRIVDADAPCKWHFFEMGGALYAVAEYADGTASKLFINGDRGKATSATITATTISFDHDFGPQLVEAIYDSAGGFSAAGFAVGQTISVSGSTSNDGNYTITYVSDYYLYVSEDVVDEAAGASITITATAQPSSLSDTDQSWDDDIWTNAMVRITAGTGKGQYRKISGNGSAVIVVDTNWDIEPSTDSEYVIYSTNRFTELTTTGITGAVKDVCVFNNIALFAQGDGTDMRRMRFNASASPPAHEYEDDTGNKADLLLTHYKPGTGVQIWRALNGTTMAVSRSDPAAWGTPLSFGTGVEIGDQTYDMTNIVGFGSVILVCKEDSVWRVITDKAEPIDPGLKALANPNNGKGATTHGVFFYFNWDHSIERLFGRTLDDIGPWKDEGLPYGRRGYVEDIIGVAGWIIAALNADDGTSSVLIWNDYGLHEIFRAWEAGQRVRSVHWQACPGANPRLWISVGGDIVCMEFPKNTLNPIQDSGMLYQPEAVLVSSTFDLRKADLSKMFKEIRAQMESLGEDAYIGLDYQVDDFVGTSTWVDAGTFFNTLDDTKSILEGNRKRIRCRLRLMTKDVRTPAVINAMSLYGFTRTPVKRQWTLRVKTDGMAYDRGGAKMATTNKLIKWLDDIAQNAKRIRMRSKIEELHNLDVVVEPYIPIRDSWYNGDWTGSLMLMIREV